MNSSGTGSDLINAEYEELVVAVVRKECAMGSVCLHISLTHQSPLLIPPRVTVELRHTEVPLLHGRSQHRRCYRLHEQDMLVQEAVTGESHAMMIRGNLPAF